MKLLMLSTDRNMLDTNSAVFQRTEEYAEYCESLTVVLAGKGKPNALSSGKLHIIYPGGGSKAVNFFRMLYATRLQHAEVVTAQDPFFMGLIGVLSGKRPLQIQLHTDRLGFVGLVLAFITLRSASCVRVVSEQVKNKIKYLTRVPITVLPIYVATEELRAVRPRPPEFGDHPVVLTVSRLAPEKRVDSVIRALRSVPQAHLYIVGDGPLRPQLERLTVHLSLSDRVHFLGWKHDVAAYYQHADCFVQMSAYEGYGMSLVEAVLSGCPAISTNVGVAAELSKELVTISTSDEYDLAGALKTVLSQKPRMHGRDAHEALLRSMPSKQEYLEHYYQLLMSCGT